METDLQLKWRSVARAIFGKGIHGNCPFAAALPSNYWAVQIICFSSWIPHVVRLCIQGCDFWNVENGNMSSADRRSDIMKWGGRVSPPPPPPTSPGELDQGQCGALAEKSGLSVGHLVADCWPGEAADLISRGTGVVCVCHQPPTGCKGQMGLKWFHLFFRLCLCICTEAPGHIECYLHYMLGGVFWNLFRAQNETHLGRVNCKCYSCHYLKMTAL